MSLLPLKFASADAVPEGLRDYFKAGEGDEMVLDGFDGVVAKGPDGEPQLGKDGKALLTMQEFGEGLRESAPHLFQPSSGGGASASASRGGGVTKAVPRDANGLMNVDALAELKSTDPARYKQIIDNKEHLKVEKQAA